MDRKKILTRLLCVVGVCTLIPSAVAAKKKYKSPILLIPGLGGSQLDEKTKGYRPDTCWTHGRYQKVWYDIQMTPNCAKDLSLRYDKSSNTYRNKTGVKIRVPGFGETNTVEYSVKDTAVFVKKIKRKYMRNLVEHFAKCGYERGVSIRAAPYDWRLAADELDRTGYFKEVKGLIEEMRKANRQRVTIVAHSMGGLVSHYFLTSYSGINKSWKKKHIKAWITLGTPWGGAIKTIQPVLANKKTAPLKCEELSETLIFLIKKSPIIKHYAPKCASWSILVPFGRTFESTAWLLPKPSLFGDKVLVETNSRKYTANDYEKLFDRINYDDGYAMFKGTQQINSDKYPNVPTYCYYGKKVKSTPEKFTYTSIKDSKPKITYGDGDGTVNIESLRACDTQWSGRKKFKSKEFDSVDHQDILSDKAVLKYIAKIVGARGCGSMEQLEQLLEALN